MKMVEIVKPDPLKRGDTIGIFSPSEPLTEERKNRVMKSVEMLKGLGYRVKLASNVFNSLFYMAGGREERADDINQLLRDQEVKVLWTSWGGKSANQILDLVDWEQLQAHPKIVIGFSDTTNLINAVFARARLVAFHGPHVAGKISECSQSTIDAGFETFTRGAVRLPEGVGESVVIRNGVCEGQLVGGNLKSFILSNLGTEYQPSLDGALLFWEAGSGSPQEIDQYLTYMRLCGVFEKISGMLVGDLSNCKDSRDWGGREVAEVIRDVTAGFGFPIIQIPTFGHGNVPNVVIPVGCRARIDTEGQSFEVLEACTKI